jgi:tetratricopeptide (TPR) repeat protein
MRLKPDGPGFVSSDFRYIDGLEGSSGIYSTDRDLFRLDRALYTSKLVSQSSIREAFTPAKLKNGQATRYGFGWFLGDGTVSHDGYATGFGVWIYRELNEENTVIILTTGGLYLWSGINQGVRRILHGEECTIPKKDGMRLVQLALFKDGEEEAHKVYTNLRQNRFDEYFFEAGTLNVTGRLLLIDQRPADALKALQLNAELYPEMPVVWDGLAEAYLALGDTTNAIQNYRKTLAQDPTFQNAINRLHLLTNK